MEHKDSFSRKSMIGRIMVCVFCLLAWDGILADYLVDFDGDGETKTSYASGRVWLGDVEWEMSEALIGNLASDKREGPRALRMRRTGTSPGRAEMLNDKPGGMGTVSFLYAGFGTDSRQPALIVEYSGDGGTNWNAVGAPVTVFPSNLTAWSQEVNVAGNVRVRFRTDMSELAEQRFNIDSLALSDYGTSNDVPVVVTRQVDGIGPDRGTAFGEVLADNGSAVSERGFLVSAVDAPTTYALGVGCGAGIGEFSTNFTGLVAGGGYEVRAYAENEFGMGYGQSVAFNAAAFTNAPILGDIARKTASGFEINWTPVAGAHEYQVELAADDRFNPGGEGTACAESVGDFTGDTRTIATYDAEGGFDNSGILIYGDGGSDNAADIRTSYASEGYTNGLGEVASGGANVYFRAADPTNTYGFAMGAIDCGWMTDIRLGYAYRKESVAANARFEVAFRAAESDDWIPVPATGMPAEDAGTGWRWMGPFSLGVQAEGAEALSLRWVNTNGVPMRIDDILLRGDFGAGSLIREYILPASGETGMGLENLGRGRYYVRVRAIGAADCRSEYSNVVSVYLSGGSLLILR